MGLSYSAGVFFGAFVPRSGPLGKKLDRYVDKAGGTPARTETPGVEISHVGSHSSGEIWIVVRAVGSGMDAGREDEIEAPHPLIEDPSWRPALLGFFARLKVKDPPALAWHFQNSVD